MSNPRKYVENAFVETKNQLLQTENIQRYGDELYIYNEATEMIIAINILNGMARVEARIGRNPKLFPRYRMLIENDGLLYFVPCRDNHLGIYELKSKAYQKILLPEECKFDNEKAGFVGYLKTNKGIILFGYQPIIVMYIFESKDFKVYKDWIYVFDGEDYPIWFWRDAFVRDEYLYILPLNKSSVWLKIDLETGNSDLINIGDVKDVFGALKYIGRNLNTDEVYFLHSNGGLDSNIDNIVKWDEKNNSVEVIDTPYLSACNLKVGFEGRFIENGKIWLIQGTNNYSYVIDEKSYTVEKVQIPSSNELKQGYLSIFNYSGFYKDENEILTIHPWSSELIEISTKTGNVKTEKITWSEEANKKIRSIVETNNTLDEKTLNDGLRTYINSLICTLE